MGGISRKGGKGLSPEQSERGGCKLWKGGGGGLQKKRRRTLRNHFCLDREVQREKEGAWDEQKAR